MEQQITFQIGAGIAVTRTVPQVVDLVYRLIDQLAELDDGSRELRRDEDQVRADAEIREGL